ncbi:hypothetical protein DICVIV_09984 [Dictyocaulus viviparus]|uniref:BEACH domain-containing protein n=1 Tax=Dictyocaulus viviparus TaxID=29172 RepID=A0A0D8XNP4_DICVI|nr:hypothetical protein DICVIV_09984 [Dictyocaulus viviparus]
MVRSYGQMPMQLLHVPHQPHLSFYKDNEVYPAPVRSVRGIRWGDYVGNPLQNEELINVVFSLKTPPEKKLLRIICLPNGLVVGVPPRSLVVFRSSHQSKATVTVNLPELQAIGIVSVFMRTLVFRICIPSESPWLNIAELDDFQVSSMGFSPRNYLIILGSDSGVISTYEINFNAKGIRSIRERFDLLGHSQRITSIAVCDEFNIFITADSSGKAIVWDSNRHAITSLTFIRLLRQSSASSIRSVCISRTTADIAVAVDINKGSIVEFYTINGDLIKKIGVDVRVLCMAMSNQSEGTAVNCLALGLQSGDIRLVETWRLSTIRTIRHPIYTGPVTSMQYSLSARKLFVTKTFVDAELGSDSDCTHVLVWQYGVAQKKQNINGTLQKFSDPFEYLDCYVPHRHRPITESTKTFLRA